MRWSVKDTEDHEEEVDMDTQFQQKEGIEQVFARQVTATDNREAFLWKCPLMQQVTAEASSDK